jgi:hypothetical protein
MAHQEPYRRLGMSQRLSKPHLTQLGELSSMPNVRLPMDSREKTQAQAVNEKGERDWLH